MSGAPGPLLERTGPGAAVLVSTSPRGLSAVTEKAGHVLGTRWVSFLSSSVSDCDVSAKLGKSVLECVTEETA